MKKIIVFCTIMVLFINSGCSQAASNTSSLTTQSTLISSTPVYTSESSTVPSAESKPKFTLRSPEVIEGGMLPKDYTCDGSRATLPLEWSGESASTQSFALVMYTLPNPKESHWYWVLYNIPSSVHSLIKNVTGVGTLGNNSVNGRTEYAPPCSKGPGAKQYTYTIYALSALPQFSVPAVKVSRDVLLSAIKDITLASAELNVYYSRQNGGG
jgi:phosphatidylethanolamine-binding protein (PEBP) family uncharacterized protein